MYLRTIGCVTEECLLLQRIPYSSMFNEYSHKYGFLSPRQKIKIGEFSIAESLLMKISRATMVLDRSNTKVIDTFQFIVVLKSSLVPSGLREQFGFLIYTTI